MRSSPSLAAVSTALLFAYSQQLVAALSDAQIASVFGTGDQLTGGQTSLPQFDFTVVTNASELRRVRTARHVIAVPRLLRGAAHLRNNNFALSSSRSSCQELSSLFASD